MGSPGRTAGTIGGAAAGTAIMPGVGTVIGAGLGGLIGGAFDSDNAAPGPNPANAQFGAGNGSQLTNQLAAQQYAAGLGQQQAQNSREAALYNQANNNFDIANAAQMRGPAQISSTIQDKQNQLAALGGINSAANSAMGTGNQLTALGTRPMGDSYAEAQLREGQAAAEAQQLSAARTGRSLGSGQAAMSQAMFNNAATNQVTNQQATQARIQEQNAYNQFQAGALGQAGNAYSQAGSLSGQAGNAASTIRAGNEGVQLQNANLGLQQQGVNNQTTGIYNQLGAGQQGLGMQANQIGQGAYQFGAGQAFNMQNAQLNANMGLNGQTAQTNLANQQNANLHDAANANAAASAAGGLATLADGASTAAPSNTSTAPQATNWQQAQGAAADQAGQGARLSDKRQKTNLHDLESGASMDGGTQPTTESAPRKSLGQQAGEYAGKFVNSGAPPAPAYTPPTYAQTIAALNAGYAPSQSAPADVLWQRPGAGAPASGTQASLLNFLQGQSGPHAASPGAPMRDIPAPSSRNYSDQGAADIGTVNAVRAAIPGAIAQQTADKTGAAAAASMAQPAPAAPWADVFNRPNFGQLYGRPDIDEYLGGATPPAPVAPTPAAVPPVQGPDSHIFVPGREGQYRSSDVHSKTRIRELEGQLAALQGAPSASFAPQQPDTAALDAAYGRQGQAPAIDLRPARGYSYEYKNPNAPGAAPGTQVGPMAQDLEQTAAAPAVHDTPHGKQVDTGRLAMVNTAAISELQRKMQQLEALGGGQPQPAPYQQSNYPQARAPY